MCAREYWGRGGRGFVMLFSWGVWAIGLGIVWMVGLRSREVGCSETWQTGWVGGGGGVQHSLVALEACQEPTGNLTPCPHSAAPEGPGQF